MEDRKAKKKNFLNPNNSTMNRIWKRFSTIGNINMNMAEVGPFNYQMLLACAPPPINYEAVNLFCEMDDSNYANRIEAAMNETDYEEREKQKAYDILADVIVEEFDNRYGEEVFTEAYPSIVRYLFTDDNLAKSAHKQMFWRVFGRLAISHIQDNLKNCRICPHCGMRTPSWNPVHECAKDMAGFVTCCDCGRIVPRINSRQVRCPDCQAAHKRALAANRKRRQRKKVA